MRDLEQTIFCIVSVLILAALVVVTVENSRRMDVLTADVREMRASMGEAGFLPREPQIIEQTRGATK